MNFNFNLHLNFKNLLLIYLALANILANCASITPTDSGDSYLSAYKLTHDLNEHPDGAQSDGSQNVFYVDANTHSDYHVHPVYVHNQLDDGHPVDHHEEHLAAHADHVDVEHHYIQDHHEDVHPTSASSGFGSYGPPPINAGAHHGYGHQVGTYGPPIPINHYHKRPSHVYGPPSPVYVPPTLPPVYIPNHGHYYEPEAPSYIPNFLTDIVSPHAFLGILDKIKLFKIDLFTIGKLILKFFIFKKILTFLTILFLLLVIPSFKHKGKETTGMMGAMVDKFGMTEEDDDDDDDDAGRNQKRTFSNTIKTSDHMNSLTGHVLESIESFERKLRFVNDSINPKNCGNNSSSEITNEESVYCKSQSVIEKIKRMISPYLHMDTHGDTNGTNVSKNKSETTQTQRTKAND